MADGQTDGGDNNIRDASMGIINEVTSHKHLGVIFYKRLQLAQSY